MERIAFFERDLPSCDSLALIAGHICSIGAGVIRVSQSRSAFTMAENT